MTIDGGLRPIIRLHIKQCHWQSIETGLTGAGVPDANYCFPNGVEGWIECKLTSAWRVRLRPEQIGWILTRVRYGGRVSIAVRRKNAGEDELWLLKGSAASADLALNKLPRGVLWGTWSGGPSSWDWAGVARALKA